VSVAAESVLASGCPTERVGAVPHPAK